MHFGPFSFVSYYYSTENRKDIFRLDFQRTLENKFQQTKGTKKSLRYFDTVDFLTKVQIYFLTKNAEFF